MKYEKWHWGAVSGVAPTALQSIVRNEIRQGPLAARDRRHENARACASRGTFYFAHTGTSHFAATGELEFIDTLKCALLRLSIAVGGSGTLITQGNTAPG